MPGVTMESPNNMASAISKSPAESGASAPGFSYAQAAKGRAASANASVAQSSQGPSGTNTPAKTSSSTAGTPAASVNGTSTVDSEKNMTSTEDAAKEAQLSEVTKKPSATTSTPSSPSFGSASTSTLPKEEEPSTLPPHLAEGSWRSPRPKTPNEHIVEGSERRSKGKKNKKEKAAEKEAEKEKEREKEEVKQEVLVAAPPPAVNIWTQRKAQAAAKTKVTVDPTPALTAEVNPGINAPEQSSKSTDSKKKARPTSSDGPNGVSSTTSKAQKKGVEGSTKKDDGRRSGPRGARVGDKEEKTATSPAPPPVEDAISWPTPETALEEEKRKTVEKGEKEEAEDSTSTKPRAKKEWVSVPFTPTVTFNTPLPARGGRGRGGGRGGRESGGRGAHASSGSISGEKSLNGPAAATNSTSDSRERARESSSSTRAASLPPNASKKAAGDAASVVREPRKPSATSNLEKWKADATGQKQEGKQTASRRESIAPQAEAEHEQSTSAISSSQKQDQADNTLEQQAQSESASTERRNEQNSRSGDQFNPNGHGQSRERGENRGRGGYRGRGGHNNFVNGQAPFTNGHTQQPPNGYGLRQNSVPYSPVQQSQPQFSNGYPANGQRGRNGPTRASSIPTGSQPMYGRYPQNGPGGMQQIGGMQGYDYQGQPMGQFIDWSVFPMVLMQMEYYFSIDNLCKDVYLRKHMDSQGFVFLTFIGRFKRITSLTPELEVLRVASQESEVIEIVTGDDGLDRVRRMDGWEKWVMPLEERDEVARNSGPQQIFRQFSYSQREQMNQRMMAQGHQAMSPPPFSPNGTEQGFRHFMAGPPIQMGNGLHNGEYGHQTESPLSAAVPDFSPGLPVTEKSDYSNDEITFTDVEVEGLVIVYNTKDAGGVKPKAPYHTAASRTFSNGSIDSRAVTEELAEIQKRQARPNGSQASDSSPESTRRSRSPLSSPTKQVFGNAPPVMWVKGQKNLVSVSDSHNTESYNVVRERALRGRETAHGPDDVNYDMKVLYNFWPHFLVRNFNPGMYEEFHRLSLEDAQQRQDMLGMVGLMAFYDEILLSKRKIMNETLARHYVEAVRLELESPSNERPGLAKLRSAWRNGALQLKSRKRIADHLDPKLRDELER